MRLAKKILGHRRQLDAAAAALAVLGAISATAMGASEAALALWWASAVVSILLYAIDPAGFILRRMQRARHRFTHKQR